MFALAGTTWHVMAQERIPIGFISANLTAHADSVGVAPAERDRGSPIGNDRIVRIHENENGSWRQSTPGTRRPANSPLSTSARDRCGYS